MKHAGSELSKLSEHMALAAAVPLASMELSVSYDITYVVLDLC
jgi:hypothetical protein